jgi:hypothetical protein
MQHRGARIRLVSGAVLAHSAPEIDRSIPSRLGRLLASPTVHNQAPDLEEGKKLDCAKAQPPLGGTPSERAGGRRRQCPTTAHRLGLGVRR